MNVRPIALLPALIAFCLGALTVFAFAPFGFWPLQFVTLAGLFYLVERNGSIRKSALTGLLFGFGWSLSSIHWLYVSMHRYGGMASWMAVSAVILFSIYLGCFPALVAGVQAWLKKRWHTPRAVSLLLVLPSLWTLSEWLRGWLFTGFPWVVSGYAHNIGPLAGYAPVIGVFGLGWCAALIAGCLAVWMQRRAAFRLGATIIGIAVLAGGVGLRHVDWTAPSGQPISVRLLQGNVPQEMKFSKARIVDMLKLYHGMITEAPADLIATPETAIPIFPQRLPPGYLQQLFEHAQKTKSHLLIGIPLLDTPDAYANSVIGFSPETKPGTAPYRYDKHHLVPFGEFVPPGFRWFVNLMRIPLGDFSRGDTVQSPFAVKDQQILPNICYEDLFGEEIADQIAALYYANKAQPTILLNLSNIAWFGDTIALPQHLQISQMRALETGRPMLRSTNTGVTALIDQQGNVTAQLAPYTRGSLGASVQGYQGLTPYLRWGNLAIIILAILCLTAAGFLARRQRRNWQWS